MHISNRHLRLAPIVARLAESQGLAAVQQIDRIAPGWPEGKSESHWIVMTRNQADLGRPPQRRSLVAARRVAVDAALDRRLFEHPQRSQHPLIHSLLIDVVSISYGLMNRKSCVLV